MYSIREIVENLVSAPTIPLSKARICLDCETITDVPADCPRCGSKQLWPLATWIDGKQKGAA